ncbi:hypothetical protein [Mycolicibacter virginiensis]|uniref:hypothetical protein n=1 Tax=Mycolicibacter virginiensis TaxID=1795032 RepID=UPI001F04C7E4|nr:hypothetical protein [Mycolicibacter virginiensis]ULP48020.1 hypothetical protein MJO54_02290 [Mycolicibacter virginiensis]
MDAISLSRMHLFVGADDADSLVATLATVADTAPPEWQPYARLDGSDARSATLTVGGTEFAVTIGNPCLPALLLFTVPDVPATVERLNGAGFSARVDQHGEAAVSVPSGNIVIRIVAAGGAE